MLSHTDFIKLLEELDQLDSEVIHEENLILNCGLKSFDFKAAASRLRILLDKASEVHLRICKHLKQSEGRESIEAAVNYLASLIMTANEMMEIADRLDGKTKGIKFGFLQYRKRLKTYDKLCAERRSAASKLESIQANPWKIKSLKYMPQDLFNLCAVTASKASVFTGKSIKQVSEEVTLGYIHTYSDQSLPGEVAEAAHLIIEYIQEYFAGTDEIRKLTHLQYCIDNYEADGNPKKKKFLGGTVFKYETEEIKNKPHVCICDIANFILRTEDRTIPTVPNGWNL